MLVPERDVVDGRREDDVKVLLLMEGLGFRAMNDLRAPPAQ